MKCLAGLIQQLVKFAVPYLTYTGWNLSGSFLTKYPCKKYVISFIFHKAPCQGFQANSYS